MKRILAIIVSLMLLSTVMAVPVLATETTSEVLETYEDGSYLMLKTTTVITSNARAASTTAKYADCKACYFNSNDEEQWNYTLFANFLYRYGSGAQCQNRGDTWEIINSQWSLKSHDTWIDYDSAFGTVSMKKTVLLLPVATITFDLSITCDAYGNITYDY